MRSPSLEDLGRRVLRDTARMLATTLLFAVESHNAWMAAHPKVPAYDLEPLRLYRVRCLSIAERLRRRDADVMSLAVEFEALGREAHPEITRLAKFHAAREGV